MIKRQIIAITAAALVLIAVTVLYFAVVRPAVEANSAVIEEAPETLPGEEIGSANRFYMYSHLDRSEIQSIEIVNEHGAYRLVADGNGMFYIDGYKEIALDDKMVSSLVATCGSALSKSRVTSDATEEKLAEYGLTNPVAHWIVTDNDGKQYKVYVGRALLTGGGYYCGFAGRGGVYVLDTALADTVLAPAEAFVTPYILFGISENDFYKADDFTVYHGREKYISVGKVPADQQNSPEALVENILTYPAPYTPDAETYLGTLLGYTSLTGDSTYKLGVTEEDIVACGLDDPDYTVSFTYGGMRYFFLASEADDDSYYVISGIYGDIITKVSKDSMPYLEYDLLSWLSPYILRKNISIVSQISVKTDTIDETFHLVHATAEDGSEVIQVASDSGLQLVSDRDTLNFRHYYSDLIAMAIVDYLPEEASPGVPMEEFLADEGHRTMTVSCTTTGGYTYTFEIYRYSTRRCAVSVNGRFDFCILNDVVSRIESDTELLLRGEEVVGTF